MKAFQNLLYIILISLIVSSCNSETEKNFTLNGSVKGLKKGVVYLQKEDGTSIVDLDSVVIKGTSDFTLKTNIDEPILLYLKLHKNDGQEHFIPFFADKGITEIKTTLKRFTSDAKITGSEQQVLLEEYLKLMSDFNDSNLDLIKANFEAAKRNDTITSDSLAKRSNRLLKLKYASTINFALNHGDSEVAPYLALYEAPNASVKYLDSIYNNLTDKVKQSYYGKTLGKALNDFKKAQDSIK
ncbi:uncharacterized protein DUF4369 [Winogradskyella wandonensis]|uniref:Uncharacterized protein DUF4369 n=1 Tax=Winogradskyella wandonensis TaxID=1442586 RepID=A0A4R1KP30_9FLAO|nr:DUF4369 domain-containing protein [Winogradskyella wandonensis]TCK66794.1 uncharacterized protein DUF4369 [Winogradskyella wandonensis]